MRKILQENESDAIYQLKIIKLQLKNSHITYDDAKKQAQPFIDKVNAKATEIAKKYSQKPRLINFVSFMR